MLAMTEPVFVPHADRYSPRERAEDAARAFYDVMRRRRSVRMFSPRPVSLATIEHLVRTATTAPSGATVPHSACTTIEA